MLHRSHEMKRALMTRACLDRSSMSLRSSMSVVPGVRALFAWTYPAVAFFEARLAFRREARLDNAYLLGPFFDEAAHLIGSVGHYSHLFSMGYSRMRAIRSVLAAPLRSMPPVMG